LTGELKEKILSDLKLPDGSLLKQVTGMCVIENQLWVAGAYDGLLKYDIISQSYLWIVLLVDIPYFIGQWTKSRPMKLLDLNW